MREELKEAVSALRERTGARPVLLPPPYARGHFTVRCAAAPQNDALFTFRMGEGCAFASMTDGYLAALLRKMDASSGSSQRSTMMFGLMPMPCSSFTECCVGLDLCSSEPRRKGTSVT